ncbi:MAG: hypothetical protein COA99_13195 [Moraxellaceae bacterium]|nr:MAG: hypothetical protein COA99_13195 [Moraxellaceae bacterium]
MSTVVNYFWGKGTTTPISVNEQVVLVAYEALEEANSCSDSMDLVPRPAYGALNIKYAIKQLVEIGKRISFGDTSIYNSCKGIVGVRYKSKIMMALMGV